MCARDSLCQHKFASNSKQVLEALPINDRAKDLKGLELRHDAMPVQRSLVTYLCIESDTFAFHMELRDNPLTQHRILSTISSVYNPLRAVAPITLSSKQILQALCRQNVSWHDPIPQHISPLWKKWRTELLEKLTFPHCFKPPDFCDSVRREIHSFSDMSYTGIGQISYLRMDNERN